MKDYDKYTAFLGSWGPFQKIVFFLLCCSTVPNGFSAFSVIFLAASPSHHCQIPDGNLSEAWRQASIPTQEVDGQVSQSKCQRYRLDVIRNLSALGYDPQDVNLTDIERERCVDGWTYSKDVYQSTIVTEFDLVCSNEWKQPFTSSVYFLGVLFGSFFSGQLSDRFGRKPVLFVTMMVQTCFTFLQVFSTSWEIFSILFFIVGLGQISNYVAAFVLGVEILTEPVRDVYTTLGVCLFFAIGYMLLPLIAFFVRGWKMLLVAISVPGIIYVPLWWFIPESPRWLLSQGRVEEAEAILRHAAKQNNVIAPAVIFEDIKDEDRSSISGETYNVLDLMRIRHVRYNTLILFFVWWTMSMGYFGLSLNTSQLHGDPYVNCFISAAIEVPAYMVSWLSLRYLPRRLSSSSFMMLGGIVLYFVQAVPPHLPFLSVALEMVGKFGISTAISLMFAYTVELYPTMLRNTAVGSCAMASRVGSAIAPYFIHLSVVYKYLPHILLGTLCIFSSASTLLLPESFRQPLPETIQEMSRYDRLKCPCICGETAEKDPQKHRHTSVGTIQEDWL